MRNILCILTLLTLSTSAMAARSSVTTKLIKATLRHSISFDKGRSKPKPLVDLAWTGKGARQSLVLLRAAQSMAVNGKELTPLLENALKITVANDKGQNIYIEGALGGSAKAIVGDAQRIAATSTTRR